MTAPGATAFIGATDDFAAAKAVVFGAGSDATTSYRPGTRFGPAAVRAESYGIETYSPYLDRDLEETPFFDSGDLEFPFGSPARQLEAIEARADEILAGGRLSVMLGGEHLVTLGAVCAAARRFPDLHIIHFDAHADLREDYLGEKLSHACVMRRVHELLGDGRIWQFGIRSGTREEFAFAAAGHVTMRRNDAATLGAALDAIGDGAAVYVTVDLDVLDPAELPGTGTPEAGGMRFEELRAALMEIARRVRVVGFDNVELNPMLDSSGRSTALACKLLREQLLAFVR